MTFSLPSPAANTEIGTNAMHKAIDILFSFELCTFPPLNLHKFCNNKNNINQLELQAHNAHYIKWLCDCSCLVLVFTQYKP